MKRNLIVASLLLVFAVFAEEKAKETVEEKGKSAAEAAKQKEKDPFNMEYRTNDSIPLERNSLPQGICVLGIMVKDKKCKSAIISIPGYKNSFFVKAGTVIRLDGRSQKKAAKRDESKHDNNVYLEILEISAHEVKLVQSLRPNHVYSIR